jgi:hypothetical protein
MEMRDAVFFFSFFICFGLINTGRPGDLVPDEGAGVIVPSMFFACVYLREPVNSPEIRLMRKIHLQQLLN